MFLFDESHSHMHGPEDVPVAILFGFMQQLSGLNIMPSGLTVSNAAFDLLSFDPLNCRCWPGLRYDACLPCDYKNLICAERDRSASTVDKAKQTELQPIHHNLIYTVFQYVWPCSCTRWDSQKAVKLFGFVRRSIQLWEAQLPYSPNHESHTLAFNRLRNSSLLIMDSPSWVPPDRDWLKHWS